MTYRRHPRSAAIHLPHHTKRFAHSFTARRAHICEQKADAAVLRTTSRIKPSYDTGWVEGSTREMPPRQGAAAIQVYEH